MLTIRQGQIDALNENMRKRFEERMIVHVSQFFPERCKALGENGVRQWIREGIQGAAGYDIVAERDVCKYIDVMFVFGRQFDVDPNLPWASTILNARRVDPTRKMNDLFETARKNAPPQARKR